MSMTGGFMPTGSNFADFAANAMVSHVVSTALNAGVNAIMVPTQMVLAVGTAVATQAATFLIMTTAKLALNGAVYVGSQAINGATYFFYKPEDKPKSEAFDDCDKELSTIVSNRPQSALSDD